MPGFPLSAVLLCIFVLLAAACDRPPHFYQWGVCPFGYDDSANQCGMVDEFFESPEIDHGLVAFSLTSGSDIIDECRSSSCSVTPFFLFLEELPRHPENETEAELMLEELGPSLTQWTSVPAEMAQRLSLEGRNYVACGGLDWQSPSQNPPQTASCVAFELADNQVLWFQHSSTWGEASISPSRSGVGNRFGTIRLVNFYYHAPDSVQ